MFWSRYVALCDKIGKAPNVVAAEVGVKSSGTVTGWKNGAKPRDGILQKLSAYFGVSVEYLTGEQKNTAPISEGGYIILRCSCSSWKFYQEPHLCH